MRTKICAQRKMNKGKLHNAFGKKRIMLRKNNAAVQIPRKITHAQKGKCK